MGFVYINGKRVHTSALNPNPIVDTKVLRKYMQNINEVTEYEHTFRNGEKQVVTQTCCANTRTNIHGH
jgi:hypothetical protein